MSTLTKTDTHQIHVIKKRVKLAILVFIWIRLLARTRIGKLETVLLGIPQNHIDYHARIHIIFFYSGEELFWEKSRDIM